MGRHNNFNVQTHSLNKTKHNPEYEGSKYFNFLPNHLKYENLLHYLFGTFKAKLNQ